MLKKTAGNQESPPLRPASDENTRLYKVLRIICGFSRPEDMFELKKKNFLQLCEITQIHWELKGPLFRDSPVLKVEPVFSEDRAEGESKAGFQNSKIGGAPQINSSTAPPETRNSKIGGAPQINSSSIAPETRNSKAGGALQINSSSIAPETRSSKIGGAPQINSSSAMPETRSSKIGSAPQINSSSAMPETRNSKIGGALQINSSTAPPETRNSKIGGALQINSSSAMPETRNSKIGSAPQINSSSIAPETRNSKAGDDPQLPSGDEKISFFREKAPAPRSGKARSNPETANTVRWLSDEKGAFVSGAGRPAPSGSLKNAPGAGRFERALTSGGRRYGTLIFISSRKISRKQKTFLSRMSDMVASSLCFMEDTKQLEASKNQWDLVFDSFYRALCITDSQFRILRTNRAFRRLTGRKKTETAGQNVFTVFPIPVTPPSSQKEEVTWLAESSPSTPPLSLEFLMKTVFLKNERLTFRLFLIKDVTEEIKMERKIADQTRSRELGLIKSSLAHELNNPIAGIKALLTVIEIGLTCSSQKRLLGNMHSAVDRCQETIARLLSVSRRDQFNGKANAV